MSKIYIIPDINNINESVKLAEKYNAGFEYNDFYEPSVLEDETRLKEVIEIYKALPRDRKEDTFHGAFYDITIHSSDPIMREASEKRIRQSLDIAKELGVCAVIFHTNYLTNFKMDSYESSWVVRNSEFWQKMLSEYPTIKIYIENMFDENPDMIVRLMEAVPDRERFGICFDYAHACAFGKDLADWKLKVSKYVKHIHVNDNNLVSDLHLPVGEGKIDWENFNEFIEKNHLQPSVLVEVKSVEDQKNALLTMEERKIYPFNR